MADRHPKKRRTEKAQARAYENSARIICARSFCTAALSHTFERGQSKKLKLVRKIRTPSIKWQYLLVVVDGGLAVDRTGLLQVQHLEGLRQRKDARRTHSETQYA